VGSWCSSLQASRRPPRVAFFIPTSQEVGSWC